MMSRQVRFVIPCSLGSAEVFEIQVTPTVQCTCWMRSPNLQMEVVRLLKVWQMPPLKGSEIDLQL